MTEPTITDADSGFTPENIAHAEWLWANLPVGATKFHDRPTHERALICHTIARFREASTAELRAALDEAARGFDACNVLITKLTGSPSVMVETFAERARKALGGQYD